MPAVLIWGGVTLALISLGIVFAGMPERAAGLGLGSDLIHTGATLFAGGLLISALGLVLRALRDVAERVEEAGFGMSGRPSYNDAEVQDAPMPLPRASARSAARPQDDRGREPVRDTANEFEEELLAEEMRPRAPAPRAAAPREPEQPVRAARPAERPMEREPRSAEVPQRAAPPSRFPGGEVPRRGPQSNLPKRDARFGGPEPELDPEETPELDMRAQRGAPRDPRGEIPRAPSRDPQRGDDPRFARAAGAPPAPQPMRPTRGPAAAPDPRRREAPMQQYDARRRGEEPPQAPEGDPGAVVRSGIIAGMAYTLYADGSIEAELPVGTVRFNSVAELQEHVKRSGAEADVDFKGQSPVPH